MAGEGATERSHKSQRKKMVSPYLPLSNFPLVPPIDRLARNQLKGKPTEDSISYMLSTGGVRTGSSSKQSRDWHI